MVAAGDQDRLIPMQEALASFFSEQTRACRGTACADIAGDHYPAPDPETCGRLLKTAYDGLMAILVENGFVPRRSRANCTKVSMPVNNRDSSKSNRAL